MQNPQVVQELTAIVATEHKHLIVAEHTAGCAGSDPGSVAHNVHVAPRVALCMARGVRDVMTLRHTHGEQQARTQIQRHDVVAPSGAVVATE
mgnify:CR=1 FL=1